MGNRSSDTRARSAWSALTTKQARAPCVCSKRSRSCACRSEKKKITSMRTRLVLLQVAFLLSTVAGQRAFSADYQWNLPKGFPKPYVPADNPMSEAKVELGRYLFYDTRVSVNGKQSCASCHKQELAFTDGRPVGVGATGESHSRSAMSLVNVAWSATLTWSNPEMKSLEKQTLVPMFGDHPVELGLRENDLLNTLRSDTKYRAMFERAFGIDHGADRD